MVMLINVPILKISQRLLLLMILAEKHSKYISKKIKFKNKMSNFFQLLRPIFGCANVEGKKDNPNLNKYMLLSDNLF